MFKPYNEHGASCKGHSNSLTSETYESIEDRQKLLKILTHYFGETDS